MSQATTTSPMSGSFRLFRLGGISVHLHWSWLLIAVISLRFRTNEYHSQAWAVAEYLSLFAIVLIHEFGHALACRSVGGRADHIVLWPLGGIAFVNPPPRPGALLWSIAAGPLVNVVLVPVTVVAMFVASALGLPDKSDASEFLRNLARMNLLLLVFNLLPVYPLDGGQIVRALLWFVVGQIRSLLIASAIGLVVAVIAIAVAVYAQRVWMGILSAFVAWQSFNGFQHARFLARIEASRRPDAACPACGTHPPAMDLWVCSRCRQRFDLFGTEGVCPRCGQRYAESACPQCQRVSPVVSWFARRW
ncbi:MAG TPA: site-2 protease family protein [Gemmataceae bacterium]|nr:site-2 protease family protein [Gemmataceae bacterium]